MHLNDFITLPYKDQLRTLNGSGTLLSSFEEDNHKITLYKLFDFFVELKRKLEDISFESIRILEFDELSSFYKTIVEKN